jgi:taurine dioxygenase
MSAVSASPVIAPQHFEIRPFSGEVGAEIIGLDLSRPINDQDFARIHRAHLDHHVVVFRDQRITPEQQIDFSRRFGVLQIHVLKQFLLAGTRKSSSFPTSSRTARTSASVMPASSGIPISPTKNCRAWARCCMPRNCRPRAATRCSPTCTKPGTTCPALRKAVEGRSAAHSYTARYSETKFEGNWRPTLTPEQLAQVAEVVHPVVRTHPENGRKALFVSEGFTTRIVGLPEDESKQLLDELFAHSVLPQNIYRHQWQPHDLVFWDNRSLIHLAAGCPSYLRRKLYRTTIQGDAPF